MRRNNGPRVVVLDFDGVILQSVSIKTAAFRALFSSHPEHQDAIEALHLRLGGISRHTKFRLIYRDILGLPVNEHDMAQLAERFQAEVKERVIASPFVPGAREFLAAAQAKVPLYVASGTPSEELRDIVAARGLERCFAGVYGSPQDKADILAMIASDTGCPPGDIVMVGDADTDYQAAARAGTRFVGIVAPGDPPCFPAETLVLPDLHRLGAVIGLE
ncbi:MAG: HAD family hydrolase [Bacteroidota bacterium]